MATGGALRQGTIPRRLSDPDASSRELPSMTLPLPPDTATSMRFASRCGSSSIPITGPRASTTARSIALRSSRTLPGHS